MKHARVLIYLLLFLGCAAEPQKGEVIHIQEVEGLSGYNVYIRDAETPQFTTYAIIKNTEPFRTPGTDNIDSKTDSLSPLYYYRSSNPKRLTRKRLRRF